MLKQLVRFLGVGTIATLLQYLILIALVEFLGISAVAASATGFAISAVFNYSANYYFTFASQEKHRVAGLKFALVASLGLVLNTLSMYLLVDLFALQYLIAQILSTGLVLVWNFFANRHWTYKVSGARAGSEHG